MQSQIGGVAELRKGPMRDGQNKCIVYKSTCGITNNVFLDQLQMCHFNDSYISVLFVGTCWYVWCLGQDLGQSWFSNASRQWLSVRPSCSMPQPSVMSKWYKSKANGCQLQFTRMTKSCTGFGSPEAAQVSFKFSLSCRMTGLGPPTCHYHPHPHPHPHHHHYHYRHYHYFFQMFFLLQFFHNFSNSS